MGMFNLLNDDMRNMTSASKRAEDCFACQPASRPTKRYCFLFSGTVYAVSVFALLCLLASAVVVEYFLHVRVAVVVYVILILRLLVVWPVYCPEYEMSAQ